MALSSVDSLLIVFGLWIDWDVLCCWFILSIEFESLAPKHDVSYAHVLHTLMHCVTIELRDIWYYVNILTKHHLHVCVDGLLQANEFQLAMRAMCVLLSYDQHIPCSCEIHHLLHRPFPVCMSEGFYIFRLSIYCHKSPFYLILSLSKLWINTQVFGNSCVVVSSCS
jgi:hypothetical protein